ncbi:MAG: hypothetical protein H6R10_1995 [Rhodocyclaceae bacterium]|nr:hypothetical protein [Rhodocyclaceae bacterium]
MIRHPFFLDDHVVAVALDEAATTATQRLAELLPELDTAAGEPFRKQLHAHLAAMLTGQTALPRLVHGEDTFGDRFSLDDLPLPRAGMGYAVQRLDTDTLLDRTSGTFLPVRDPGLSGLFESFDRAHAAARDWLKARNATVDAYPLAIVPASYDGELRRHVLIYGVLTQSP